MLDFLKELKTEKGHDIIFFLPGPKQDSYHIEGGSYKTPGEKVGGNSIGDEYHIILFKNKDENDDEIVVYNIDKFEAVLSEPLEYISNLIKDEWYGIVAKRTTTSNNFIQRTFDKLKNQ